MDKIIFRWENAPHQSAKTAQICDVHGHRLYAKRLCKGSRLFTVVIDGRDLRLTCQSMEIAKHAAERHINKPFTGDNQ